RLARAVRSDDAAKLAVIDSEAQIVERFEAVEADRDAVEIKDWSVRRIDRVTGDAHADLRKRTGDSGVDAVHPFGAHRSGRDVVDDRARSKRQSCPITPRGKNSVTRMNNRPRKKSQTSGNATVNQLFAP